MDQARLRELLRGGPVWGAEIDIRFRVLALTIEPAADVHPDPDAPDARLQVLLHPVSAVAASLVEDGPEGRTVLRFAEDQLPDVVAALDGPVPVGDPLPEAPADLDALADRLSMRGEAQMGDGYRRHLHLRLEADGLALDLWASFDEVEVRGPEDAQAAARDR